MSASAPPRERPPRAAEAALERLRSEQTAMLAAVRRVEAPLVHGALSDSSLRAVDDGMRDLRLTLPRHLVVAEQALYPEVASAAPESAGRLRGLVMLHHAAEEALSRLQAASLALAVDPASVGTRRRAARGARDLRAGLEALFAAMETGPLSLGEERLSPEAWQHVESALAAATEREALKAAQRR